MAESKGFFGNISIVEMLPLIAGGYGAYYLFDKKNTVPAIAAAGATLIVLNGVSSTAPTSESEPKDSKFEFGNFGVTELLAVAAYGYAAYEAFGTQGGTLAGAALACAGVISLFLSGKSGKDFE